MFTYAFYIGGMVLVAAALCGILFMSYRESPEWVQNTAGRTKLAAVCCAAMAGLPYAGWSHATRSLEITRRNNAFAALESEIVKKDFDEKCTFNGYKIMPGAVASTSLPCISRSDLRIVSNPFRAGLTYFVIGRNGTPEHWKGILDYPLPFSFQRERRVLDVEQVRTAFLDKAIVVTPNLVAVSE